MAVQYLHLVTSTATHFHNVKKPHRTSKFEITAALISNSVGVKKIHLMEFYEEE